MTPIERKYRRQAFQARIRELEREAHKIEDKGDQHQIDWAWNVVRETRKQQNRIEARVK